MGVVFFPSFSFIGVMLFPNFALGNVSGGGDTLLVSPSLFFILLSLPLLSSPSPSFPLFFHISFSFFPFLPHKLFPSLFFFSSFPSFSFPFPSYALSFPSPSFLPPSSALSFPSPSFFLPKVFFFFLRELLVPSISEM